MKKQKGKDHVQEAKKEKVEKKSERPVKDDKATVMELPKTSGSGSDRKVKQEQVSPSNPKTEDGSSNATSQQDPGLPPKAPVHNNPLRNLGTLTSEWSLADSPRLRKKSKGRKLPTIKQWSPLSGRSSTPKPEDSQPTPDQDQLEEEQPVSLTEITAEQAELKRRIVSQPLDDIYSTVRAAGEPASIVSDQFEVASVQSVSTSGSAASTNKKKKKNLKIKTVAAPVSTTQAVSERKSHEEPVPAPLVPILGESRRELDDTIDTFDAHGELQAIAKTLTRISNVGITNIGQPHLNEAGEAGSTLGSTLANWASRLNLQPEDISGFSGGELDGSSFSFIDRALESLAATAAVLYEGLDKEQQNPQGSAKGKGSVNHAPWALDSAGLSTIRKKFEEHLVRLESLSNELQTKVQGSRLGSRTDAQAERSRHTQPARENAQTQAKLPKAVQSVPDKRRAATSSGESGHSEAEVDQHQFENSTCSESVDFGSVGQTISDTFLDGLQSDQATEEDDHLEIESAQLRGAIDIFDAGYINQTLDSVRSMVAAGEAFAGTPTFGSLLYGISHLSQVADSNGAAIPSMGPRTKGKGRPSSAQGSESYRGQGTVRQAGQTIESLLTAMMEMAEFRRAAFGGAAGGYCDPTGGVIGEEDVAPFDPAEVQVSLVVGDNVPMMMYQPNGECSVGGQPGARSAEISMSDLNGNGLTELLADDLTIDLGGSISSEVQAKVNELIRTFVSEQVDLAASEHSDRAYINRSEDPGAGAMGDSMTGVVGMQIQEIEVRLSKSRSELQQYEQYLVQIMKRNRPWRNKVGHLLQVNIPKSVMDPYVILGGDLRHCELEEEDDDEEFRDEFDDEDEYDEDGEDEECMYGSEDGLEDEDYDEESVEHDYFGEIEPVD
ncbi:hypothetical protein BJ742DRAFT_134037 [Cladochytrium replicatum]|nr:hypothetical protein BJ742DRAFT_134037 [Cladochytrium replicatum]